MDAKYELHTQVEAEPMFCNVTSLVCLGASAKLRRRKPKVLVALHVISEKC